MKKAWLLVANLENWQIAIQKGIFGIDKSPGRVRKIKKGDYIVAYVTKSAVFAGTGHVTKPYFYDETPIWKDSVYPHRFGIEIDFNLSKVVPVMAIKDKLKFIISKTKWPVHFRGGIGKISLSDFQLIKTAIGNSKVSLNKMKGNKIKTVRESTRDIGNQFHDRIEKLFKNMGFKILFSDYNAPGPDIIVEHDSKNAKAKILIQCKKHLQEKNQSLKSYPSLESLIDEYSRKTQKEKADVAILVLSGYKTSRNIDLMKVLEKDHVAIWVDNVIEYYEDLLNKIGEFAKYQLLSDLNINLPFDDIRKFDAIEIEQSGFKFFVFKVEPEWLLKSTAVIRRLDLGSSVKGYQRLLNKNRIKKDIPQFLNSENWVLPNAIVCATKPGIKLKFKKNQLYIPSKYGALWIIDGQHRLYGFTNVDDPKVRKDSKILCSLFDSNYMGKETEVEAKQAQIFIDLNLHAKRIDKSLLLELEEMLGIAKIPLRVVMRLSKTKLFKDRIRGYSTKRGTISLTTFATNSAINSLTSVNGPLIKNRTSNPKEMEEICFKALYKYFEKVEKVFKKEWWSMEYALVTDKGIRALLKLFQKIINYCNGKLDWEEIEKILLALKKANPGLKKEDFKNKYAGEAGANQLVFEWSSYITSANEFIDFEPNVKIETLKSEIIQKGDKEKAKKIINEWFKLLEGNVRGILMHIDDTTFNFLKQLPWEKISQVRIFFGNMNNENKCKQLLKEMKEKKLPIILTKASKIPQGSYFHERWIGNDEYQIYLNSDLKLDSIANNKHIKELKKWKNPPRLIDFERDWEAAKLYHRVDFEYDWGGSG
jgi:DGQHR domain-containing protein